MSVDASGSVNLQVLSSGVGYGVVIGIGMFFAVIMTLLTKAQARYTVSVATEDEFNTASRSIKPGLIASGVVSAWTWAATLLQSATAAYSYGVSGPYWYAAGGTVQILLFAMVAVKIKKNANGARTWLEIVRSRFGTAPHLIFMAFGLTANFLVSSMLLLGGSAVVNALTGMNVYAANFLIPIGVALYVYFGGLRATLLCDWSHTTALIAIILLFSFAFFSNSITSAIGSPGAMYDLLQAAAAAAPLPTNAEGSFLTMYSLDGLAFGVVSCIGGFGTVFLDQVYFQRAVASRPETCVKAYLLGGLSWFAVPFTFATTCGLGAVALGIELSVSDVNNGLAAPAAAAVLLGQSGAIAMLLLLFLAVTSAASAELIAVSSIFTFDCYLPYIMHGTATQQQLSRVSHGTIVVYAFVMSGLASILEAVGISLNWLYLFMGVTIGCGVVPAAVTIGWSKTNRTAAMSAPLIGLAAAIASWLGTTAALYDGVLTVATTGQVLPMMVGNVVSIVSGGAIVIIWSLIAPNNDDFHRTRNIGLSSGNRTLTTAKLTSAETEATADDDFEIIVVPAAAAIAAATIGTKSVDVIPAGDIVDDAMLDYAFHMAALSASVLALILVILIPLTLFGTQYVYSKGFYIGYTIVSIALVFCAGGCVVIYPIYESREALMSITKGVCGDLMCLVGMNRFNSGSSRSDKTEDIDNDMSDEDSKYKSDREVTRNSGTGFSPSQSVSRSLNTKDSDNSSSDSNKQGTRASF